MWRLGPSPWTSEKQTFIPKSRQAWPDWRSEFWVSSTTHADKDRIWSFVRNETIIQPSLPGLLSPTPNTAPLSLERYHSPTVLLWGYKRLTQWESLEVTCQIVSPQKPEAVYVSPLIIPRSSPVCFNIYTSLTKCISRHLEVPSNRNPPFFCCPPHDEGKSEEAQNVPFRFKVFCERCGSVSAAP